MRYVEKMIYLKAWSRSMKVSYFLLVSCLVMTLGATQACTQNGVEPAGTGAALSAPAEFHDGEQKFNANCSRCHGMSGVGTTQGPPLVHKVYEPNHHGDVAFQRAVTNGVKAHHWQFGDMPKLDPVTPEDVDQIVKYVRWLQKQAGIF